MRSKRNDTMNEGFVLVTVLWMLVILTVITLGFSHRAMMERRMAWYEMDRAQARAMARGAVNRAMFELSQKEAIKLYLRQDDYDGLNQQWARPVDLLHETNYYSISNDDAFAKDSCTYLITDCASRISINDAPRELIEQLEIFDFRAVDAIMERREHRDGSEQVHRFQTVDEVLTMDDAEDVDQALWYGDRETVGPRSLLTVWGVQHEGLINVNTAPREVLALIPDLEESVLEALMVYRMGPDEILGTKDDRAFKDIRMLWQELNVSAEAVAPLFKYCKTNSQWFKITTRATRRRGNISAYCTVIVEMQRGEPTIKSWREGIIAS